MGRYRRALRWGVPSVLALVIAVAVVASLPGSQGPNGPSTAPTTDDGAGSPNTTAVPVPLDDPATAATAFLNAWKAQDWVALEALIGPGADLATSQHAAWLTDLDVTSLELSLEATTVETTAAVASYIVEVGVGDAGIWRYRSEVGLVAHGTGWLVRWQPSALHPSLGTGDHLEVVARWPQRAVITDVTGRAVVAEEPEVIVGLIPGRVGSRDELAAAFAAELGITRDTIDGILDAPGVQPDWYLPVTRIDRVTYIGVRPELYPVPGVAFRVEAERVPVYASLGAELIGTTGDITAELLEVLGPPYRAGLVVGRSGVERAFETVLAGKPTYDIVRRSPSGDDVVVHGFPGSPGDAVTLGIRLEAQRAAEDIVAEAELPTAIVAIDVATGEIRAAASSPAGGFNEALSGLYPPGSTFKIIVAAALLEGGYVRDDVVDCPETVTVSGKEFRNAGPLPTRLTFEQALARSCNTAFIQLGTSLDPAALVDAAQRFGFDINYTIGLASAGGRFDPTGDAVVYAASMIGQGGVLASPLHMASVAATVASGEWRVPSVVAGGNSDPLGSFETSVMADLRAMMRAVVAGGTGTAAAIDGRDIAGKTGTAEVGEGNEADTVAWFVGFDDTLAFAVAVEGGSSGGGAAAPLARRFLLELEEPIESSDETVACVPAGADWPTFQGTGTRVGCSDAAPILDPELKWSADVGIQAWLNSPIVVGTTVVVGSAGTSRAAPDTADGVYALDLSDGSLRWTFTTANDVNGIAATEDLVIVAGDEGAIWGLDLADGTERWRVDTGANVFGHPVIVGDLAVVGDRAGTLWAVGLDGTVRWQAALDGALRGGPASDGSVIYAVSDLGDVGAFSVNGFELWRERILFDSNAGSALAVVYGSPTIVGDQLVVTISVDGGPGSPGLVSLDRYIGTTTWWGSDPLGVSEQRWANVRSSVAVAGDGLVLASSVSGGPQLIAVDTGQAKWIGVSGVDCERQWASPVVVGDLVVLPRPDGAVYGFDVADGSLRWRMPLPTPDTAGTVIDCTTDGGLRISDGAELQASAAIAPNGLVIVASAGRHIFAIGDGP